MTGSFYLQKVFLFLDWKNYSLGRCKRFVKTPPRLFIGRLRSGAPSAFPRRAYSKQSFLLSYCTKINQYLNVKSKCTLFLQSNNQYLVQILIIAAKYRFPTHPAAPRSAPGCSLSWPDLLSVLYPPAIMPGYLR